MAAVLRTLLLLMMVITVTSVELDRDFPGPKLWWTKQLTRDVYIGGRPSVRGIKYLCESGFKSIITMFNFTSQMNMGGDIMPTSEEERVLAEECGMTFAYVWEYLNLNWPSSQTVDRFGLAYQEAKKPIYFHCLQGYSAAFASYTYLAKISNNKITVDDVLQKGATLGYDWTMPSFKVSEVISSILGNPIKPLPAVENDLPRMVFSYWWPKSVSGKYFISGQFVGTQPEFMKNASIDAIVNLRTHGDTGGPEEVTLLNIKDNTGSGRQGEAKLRQSLIDENKPNSYISPTSVQNYESMNIGEYGDAKGYSEATERDAVTSAGIKYWHLPIGDVNLLTKRDWDEGIKPKIMEASQAGEVLIHSRTGKKAAVIGLLAAGTTYNKGSQWALKQAAEMGYHFTQENSEGVYRLLRHVLDEVPPPSSAHQVALHAGTLYLALLLTACIFYHL